MRTAVLVVATSIALTGCSAAGSEPVPTTETNCAPTPAADLTTPDGWIGFLAENPDAASVVIDDGTGSALVHDGDRDRPLASAVKVVHLGAYARAVADGSLDPNEQVPVADWQRWYVPGTDGGAHVAALTRLGIANDGTSPSDPAATVRLDDMVTAMIQESDNAVPDYLRHRLGDRALLDAADAGGWSDFRVPSLVGTVLGTLGLPETSGDPWDLAQRWAFDVPFRASIVAPSADADPFAFLAENGPRGSANDLSAWYRSVVDGTFGAGVADVRRILEYQPAPDGPAAAGFDSMGFKGGNLPGILTQAFEFRRDDDTGTTVVWLTSGLDEADYLDAMAGVAPQQQLILDAATDPAVVERIACAV